MNISVVETPGWSTETIPDWLKNEVLRSIAMCAPGPHAFLLVVPISKAFTENDYRAMVELLIPFGEGVWRHCMVLFTWGDWLNDRSIEEHIAAEGKALMCLVEKCGYRYYAVDCSPFSGDFLVVSLLEKIFDMIARNKGQYFTAQRQKPMLSWQEEWNRREQELIDRMLRAVAQEQEEPAIQSAKMAASFDGAFIPSSEIDITL